MNTVPITTKCARCDGHRWSLLDGDGVCPQCVREAEVEQRRTQDARQARKDEAVMRAYAGHQAARARRSRG